MPQEVKNLISKGYQKFAEEKAQEAIEISTQIIKMCPNFQDPYYLMALCYEHEKDLERAAMSYYAYAELSNDKERKKEIWDYSADLYL